MYKTKVLDEMALNEALTATVEEEHSHKFLRIRPHQPVPYFTAQGSIVLSEKAIAGLRDLLERNGL